MSDTLLRLSHSVVQHGPASDRVYAMKLAPEDMPEILDELEALAEEKGYGKLFAKGRAADLEHFRQHDYRAEAKVPEFFGPGEDGLFLGKYLDPERASEDRPERVREVLQVARQEAAKADLEENAKEDAEGAVGTAGVGPASAKPKDAAGAAAGAAGAEAEAASLGADSASPAMGPRPDSVIEVREATPDDLEALATCYGTVFETYPFPIFDPEHLRREQEAGTRFFGAWKDGTLVAASSMEPGGAPGTVEMTDFATLPSHRGRGLATKLLTIMDSAAARTGERIAYTIARAVSFGMNITFARRGYRFAGTLVNNTQISGSIESMNVWYKRLGQAASRG